MSGWKVYSVVLLTSLLFMLLAVAPCGGSPVSHGALDFDGDDYIEVNDPVDVTGPLTIEAWVLVRTVVDAGRIVSNRDNLGYDLDIHDAQGRAELRLAFDGSSRAEADFQSHMGTWTHIAATWAGPVLGEIKIYFGGLLAAEDFYVGSLGPSPGTLQIGRLYELGYYFDGTMDELRIWSAALDQATIQGWMHRLVTADHPDYANLEGYWRFDEGAGQIAHSEVYAGTRDGRLGVNLGDDSQDPSWVTSGVTPAELRTFGQVKRLYGE